MPTKPKTKVTTSPAIDCEQVRALCDGLRGRGDDCERIADLCLIITGCGEPTFQPQNKPE